MGTPRIIPLLALLFPEKHFLYSTIDIHIPEFDWSPFLPFRETGQAGLPFVARILSPPSVSADFDVFNPDIVSDSVQLSLDNFDQLQDFNYRYPIESCNCIFVQYDYINNVVVSRLVGKLSAVSFIRGKFDITIKSIGDSYFQAQPKRILEEDTFQQVHTFGPVEGNPLDHYGLLVDITPADSTSDGSLTVPAGWPVNATKDDVVRSLVVFAEHESLYNADDDFWVGSFASIINDPLAPNDYRERSNIDPATGSAIVGSPYAGWPSSYNAAPPPDAYYERPLKSVFCLGNSAYILKSSSGNNALANRIWFDVYGPDLAAASSWSNPAEVLRRIPSKYAVLKNPVRQQWENRTDGAKQMGSLAQRHIIRIWRRGLPEGSSSVGQPFPIAYGWVRYGKAIHAIGGKVVGQGGGSDHYIICGHRMAFRINLNRDQAAANVANWLMDKIQFSEAKIWHSLDQFMSAEDKARNPYLENINEFGANSINPFPRASAYHRIWGNPTGPAYSSFFDYEPFVQWFNAGEDHSFRYVPGDGNRQIVLADNAGSTEYSGIKLRGDEYWADVASIDPASPPRDGATDNPAHPQFLIRNGLGSSNLYFDFAGHPDFDDGFITGLRQTSAAAGLGNTGWVSNPAGILTHPADIIAHYLLTYTELNGDRSQIDWPSFRRTRGQLLGWRFSIFKDAETEGSEFLADLVKQCRCNLSYINGRWTLRYIDLSTSRKISYAFNDDNILNKKLSFERVGVGSLYSTIIVNYKYYRPMQTWGDTITFDPENNRQCAIAKQQYGVSETFTLDCSAIDEWFIANKLAHYLLDLYTQPRLTGKLTAVLDADTRNLEAGDLVLLQSRTLPDRMRLSRPDIESSLVPRQLFVITKLSCIENVISCELLEVY